MGLNYQGPSAITAETMVNSMKVYCAHSTMFVQMNVLQKLQTTTCVEVRNMNRPIVICKVDRDRTGHAIDQYSKYSSGVITRIDYM